MHGGVVNEKLLDVRALLTTHPVRSSNQRSPPDDRYVSRLGYINPCSPQSHHSPRVIRSDTRQDIDTSTSKQWQISRPDFTMVAPDSFEDHTAMDTSGPGIDPKSTPGFQAPHPPHPAGPEIDPKSTPGFQAPHPPHPAGPEIDPRNALGFQVPYPPHPAGPEIDPRNALGFQVPYPPHPAGPEIDPRSTPGFQVPYPPHPAGLEIDPRSTPGFQAPHPPHPVGPEIDPRSTPGFQVPYPPHPAGPEIDPRSAPGFQVPYPPHPTGPAIDPRNALGFQVPYPPHPAPPQYEPMRVVLSAYGHPVLIGPQGEQLPLIPIKGPTGTRLMVQTSRGPVPVNIVAGPFGPVGIPAGPRGPFLIPQGYIPPPDTRMPQEPCPVHPESHQLSAMRGPVGPMMPTHRPMTSQPQPQGPFMGPVPTMAQHGPPPSDMMRTDARFSHPAAMDVAYSTIASQGPSHMPVLAAPVMTRQAHHHQQAMLAHDGMYSHVPAGTARGPTPAAIQAPAMTTRCFSPIMIPPGPPRPVPSGRTPLELEWEAMHNAGCAIVPNTQTAFTMPDLRVPPPDLLCFLPDGLVVILHHPNFVLPSGPLQPLQGYNQPLEKGKEGQSGRESQEEPELEAQEEAQEEAQPQQPGEQAQVEQPQEAEQAEAMPEAPAPRRRRRGHRYPVPRLSSLDSGCSM